MACTASKCDPKKRNLSQVRVLIVPCWESTLAVSNKITILLLCGYLNILSLYLSDHLAEIISSFIFPYDGRGMKNDGLQHVL